MAKQAWASSLGHSTDAEFRAWGLELQTKLLAAGLVADEKTTDWTTATRPSINTEYGYEVYHLNDSLFGTAPIYLRFGYGTGTNASNPRLQFTVGTSTNGSGVLGGTALTTIQTVGTPTNAAQRPLYISLICATEGFFGMYWKCGGTSGAMPCNGFVSVCRTCDNVGTPTVQGAMVVQFPAGSLRSQGLRFAATAAAYTAQTSQASSALCINAQIPLGGESGGAMQAFVAWMAVPNVLPLFGLCGVNNGDMFGGLYSPGVTFQATLVGTTPRTYVCLGSTAVGGISPVQSGNQSDLHLAMLWE